MHYDRADCAAMIAGGVMMDEARGGDFVGMNPNCWIGVGVGVAAAAAARFVYTSPADFDITADSMLTKLVAITSFGSNSTPFIFGSDTMTGSIGIGSKRVGSISIGRAIVGGGSDGGESMSIAVGSIGKGGMIEVEGVGRRKSGREVSAGGGGGGTTIGGGAATVGSEDGRILIIPFGTGRGAMTIGSGSKDVRAGSMSGSNTICESRSACEEIPFLPPTSLALRAAFVVTGTATGIGTESADFGIGLDPYEILEATLPTPKFLAQFDSLPAAAESAPPNCVKTLF